MAALTGEPVFVIRCPRSGTTLLLDLLAGNRAFGYVSTSGRRRDVDESLHGRTRIYDTPLIGERLSTLRARLLGIAARLGPLGPAVRRRLPTAIEPWDFWEDLIPTFRPDWGERPAVDPPASSLTAEVIERSRAVVDDLLGRQHRDVLLSKYTDFPRVELMRAIFPQARFVHIRRDPHAVANSYAVEIETGRFGTWDHRGWWAAEWPEAARAHWRAHGETILGFAAHNRNRLVAPRRVAARRQHQRRVASEADGRGGRPARRDPEPRGALTMVRHNRATAFDAAWPEPSADIAGWGDLARDPNDPRAVAHDEERLGGDDWLHVHLARAAATCVGVDILEAGVAAVNGAGYDAVAHDLIGGLGPLAERGPFDVIVAGELFEHVPDLDMVFRVAPDGELIVTTPNHYSPQRVRAGQLGIVWENVDHVSYLFPSGIAELAERRGLVLAEAATVADRVRPAGSAGQQLKRTVRGSHWRNVGFATGDDPGPRAVDAGAAGRVLRKLLRPRRRFLGETFVYVVRRHVGPGPSSA